jgi:hypothetical protein
MESSKNAMAHSETKELDLPLHLQLAMRKAELQSEEMTWEQLQASLLNLYYQRLIEIQTIKDLLQDENIELEFDIPTDVELAELAMACMQDMEDEEEADNDLLQPF